MFKSIFDYFRQGGIAFIFLCLALLINHRSGYISAIGVFVILYGFTDFIKTRYDKTSFLILAYSLFYLILSSINGVEYNIYTIFLYGICPLFFYQYGKDIAGRWNTENKHIVFWFLIILLYCIDIFIVCGINIFTTGELVNIDREFSFSKDDTSGLAATLVGLSMDIGVVGLPMFILVKNRKLKLAYFILFFMSLIVTLHLLNRTGLIVLLICFICLIAYKSRKNLSVLFLGLIFMVVLWVSLREFGIISDELLDFYSERNKDLSTMGNRTDRWLSALQNLFLHPFGWINYEDHLRTYYVHNMWLDIARVSGVIPFLILVYLGVVSFVNSFKLIRKSESQLAYLMLGLNVCFFASCFVEPIYGGTHFMLYCMLWGYQNKLLSARNL